MGEFDPKTTTVEELGLYMAGAKKQGGESMSKIKQPLLQNPGVVGVLAGCCPSSSAWCWALSCGGADPGASLET